MTKTMTSVLVMTGALALVAPARVDAQTTKAAIPEAYFGITGGAQPTRRTVAAESTSTVFDEEAVFTADYRVGNGPFYDISGGYRITNGWHFGGTLSLFSSDATASGTAAIPDPLFFERPTNFAVEGSDLPHSELGIHLQAVKFLPLTRKMDLAISGGPSIFRVSQDFMSASAEDGTTTVTFGSTAESGFGFGFNAGGDFTYLLTPKYGVGVLVRYTWGKAGLDAADMTVGGLQAGIGLRIRINN